MCGYTIGSTLSRLRQRLAVLCALAVLPPLATAKESADAATFAPLTIEWTNTIEIASGAGVRGTWRQNDSVYDYVDDPTVALSVNGTVATAWVSQKHKDIFFQAYNRQGKPRHKQPVNLSRSPHIFSWLPRLVLSLDKPDEVYALWQEIVFAGGSHGGEIFFARSQDGGASFGTPINLSRSKGGDGKGRISRAYWHNGSLDLAISRAGTLYTTWTEYDGLLWFSRSSNSGESFSTPLHIAGGGIERPAHAPALAVGHDERVYLAWTIGEERSADIRIAVSNDGGQTFAKPMIVAVTSGYSDAPKLAVDRKGTVHLVHGETMKGPFGQSHIRYTRSHDGARTFEPGRKISSPHPKRFLSQAFPSLSLDGQNNVYVLWEVFPVRQERARGLAIAFSLNGGQDFSAPMLVPNSDDPDGGWNGSQQGQLMRKLAVNCAGDIAVVNSSFKHEQKSRVWLMRGRLLGQQPQASQEPVCR